MKLIPGRVAIHPGVKARLYRGDGFLFRHVVLPRVPDDFFQFQTQHPIQRRPLLCSNHLACADQVFIKTDGDILFQGKTSSFFYTFFTCVARKEGKINRKIEECVGNRALSLFKIYWTESMKFTRTFTPSKSNR